MALNYFKQRDIDEMDAFNIPDSFFDYFESLPKEQKDEIAIARPDLAAELGYSYVEKKSDVIDGLEDDEEEIFLNYEVDDDIDLDRKKEKVEEETETDEQEDIFAQIRVNRYEKEDLDKFFVDGARPLEVLTIADNTEKCPIHRCNFETKNVRYKSVSGKVYGLVLKLCRECKRVFLEESKVDYVHNALTERHIPHTFYDLDLSSSFLKSQQPAYVLGEDEKVYTPDVWTEEKPTCPIHNDILFELPCEKHYSGRKMSFKGYLCEKCNKILVRKAYVADLIDECAQNGIPEIESELLIKKNPKKKTVPKKEIRPDFFVQEGKRQQYTYSHNPDCYKLTEYDTIVISDSIYCNLDGHNTEEVLALIMVKQKREGRKAYLFLVGYCNECQKYYMDENDYKVVYNLGRPEVTVLSDLENDNYHITSGEVFNLEKRNLDRLERSIDREISYIHNQSDFINPFAVGSYDDGNLSYAKHLSKTKYGKRLDQLSSYRPKPYNYRVDITADGNTETYYVGPLDIVLDGQTKVISFNSDFGHNLVNYQTIKVDKNGKEYNIKLSRQFDIDDATLFGYANLRTDEDIIFRSGVTDPFLVRVLNMRKKQHNLIDIIATIQENQNKIVDVAFDKNIIVQGCAGSGKTMVLLHRLSSLQYKNKQFDFENESIILTPNDQFSLHIKGLAEGLQLGNIERESVEQYYLNMLLKYSNEFKPDTKFVSEMLVRQDFVDYIYSDQFKKDFGIAYDEVISKRNSLIEILDNLTEAMNQSKRTINLSDDTRVIEQIKYGVQAMEALVKSKKLSIQSEKENLDRILSRKRFLEEKLPESEKFAQGIVQECLPRVYSKISEYLQERKNIVETLSNEKEELVAERKKTQETIVVFGKKAKLADLDKRIKSIEQKEAAELQKDNEEMAIFSLLLDGKSDDEIMDWMSQVALAINGVKDEIRLCKNCKEELEKYREEKLAIESNILETQKRIDEVSEGAYSEEVERAIRYLYEQTEGYTLLGTYQKVFNKAIASFVKEHRVKTIVGKCHRYDLYAELLFAKRFFKSLPGTLKLICVDEGQDLAINEYRLIAELNQNNAIFNIFGDTNQLIKPKRGISEWSELEEFCDAEKHILNENYRNTNQITRFCNRCFDMDVLQTGVDGFKVREIARRELELNLNQSKITTERLAILVPRGVQKKKYLNLDLLPETIVEKIGDKIGNGLISLLYVDESKGIEFDKVFVVSNKMSRNEKYIAYTRALSELIVVVDDSVADYDDGSTAIIKEDKRKSISKESTEKSKSKKGTLAWEDQSENISKNVEENSIDIAYDFDRDNGAKRSQTASNHQKNESSSKFNTFKSIKGESSDIKAVTNENQSSIAVAKKEPMTLTPIYQKLKSFAGAAAKEGEFIRGDFSEADILDAIDFVFSSNSKKDTSYKFVFLKSILDLLDEVDKDMRLTFDQLFYRFTEIYWPIVVDYNLRQKNGAEDARSYIEQILVESANKYGMLSCSEFSDLTKNQQREIVKSVKDKCKMNVVGALYGDTKAVIYSFSRKGEWIKINPAAYEYLKKNSAIIQQKNYNAWADFMEKINTVNDNDEKSRESSSCLDILKKTFVSSVSLFVLLSPVFEHLLKIS